MAKQNKGPHVEYRNNIKWWKYNFSITIGGQRKKFREWISPESEMTKRQAQAKCKEIYTKALMSGSTKSESKIKIKATSQVFEDYRTYLEVEKQSTYKIYMYMKKHFEKHFSKIGKIVDTDILEYKKVKLKEGYSNAYINRHLSFCRAAFNYAKIKPNPFEGYNKLYEEPRTRYLNEDEFKRLFAQINESKNVHLKDIVFTGMLTGLRKNEVLGLHERHIDFKNEIIMLSGKVIKNKKPLTIPLPDQLKFIFKRNIRNNPSGYVFENKFTHTRFKYIDRSWREVLKNAKIKDFHFHDLRHTFATYTLLLSKDLRTVQELLGHSSVQMTQKYAHVLTEQKKIVISDLGDLFENLRK